VASPSPLRGGADDAVALSLLPCRAEGTDDVGLLEDARRLGMAGTVEAALDAHAGQAGREGPVPSHREVGEDHCLDHVRGPVVDVLDAAERDVEGRPGPVANGAGEVVRQGRVSHERSPRAFPATGVPTMMPSQVALPVGEVPVRSPTASPYQTSTVPSSLVWLSFRIANELCSSHASKTPTRG